VRSGGRDFAESSFYVGSFARISRRKEECSLVFICDTAVDSLCDAITHHTYKK